MHRYQPMFATGMSSGLTAASLVQFLGSLNWPGLLVLLFNLVLTVINSRAGRRAARREDEQRRRLEAERLSPRPCVAAEGRDRIACRHRGPD